MLDDKRVSNLFEWQPISENTIRHTSKLSAVIVCYFNFGKYETNAGLVVSVEIIILQPAACIENW